MENRSLGYWAVGILLVGSLIGVANASIHEYKKDIFTVSANVQLFHGGSEGLYASKFQDVNATDNPLKGKSFIRFDDVTFVRTFESARKQNAMQSTTGLVEAIIFEVKDREKIGGSFLKTESICCTPELSDAGSCSLGEVIIRRDPNVPEWLWKPEFAQLDL